jgi:hypothetical protein
MSIVNLARWSLWLKAKGGRAIFFFYLKIANPQIHGLILLTQIRNFVVIMAQIANPQIS